MAGNTPLKRWKREVHEGGVAVPCIVSWPGKFGRSAGGIRRQFAHVIDVLPTVLELVGLSAPDAISGVPQSHLDGTSFAYLLDAEGEAESGRHLTQYFEMLGSRAIYHDGWKAVTFHSVGPLYDDGLRANAPFEEDVWELYHVAEDVSETIDLASQHPERLSDMMARWWEEARRNDVLPLDNRPLEAIAHPKPDRRRPHSSYRYFQGGAPVPESVAIKLCNRSHEITVTLEVPDPLVPSGVLIAQGCTLGGWSLHLVDGQLRYVHNLYGRTRSLIQADRPLGPGRHTVKLVFEKDDGAGGSALLEQDGDVVAEGSVDRFTPAVFNEVGIGLTCGYEWGPAIGEGYEAPFAFNGTISRAVVSATGPMVVDPVLEVAAILAMQ